MPEMEDLIAAKQELKQRWFRGIQAFLEEGRVPTSMAPAENVVGLGVGEKVTEGSLTGAMAVRVYVDKKYPFKHGPRRQDRIPRSISGIPTDVIDCGRILAQRKPEGQRRVRPVRGGVSCGHRAITAGTVGCIVQDGPGKRYHLLSNNHVLACSNIAKQGDPILQPGPADGGRSSKDTVAKLTRFITIYFGGQENEVDAACARIAQKDVDLDVLAVGCPGTPVEAERGMGVYKSGRTTGKTTGVVEDVDADIWVTYYQGSALFKDVVAIRGSALTPKFSAGGDSGSVIFTDLGWKDAHNPCALLFAGSGVITFGCQMWKVLYELGVKLAC